MAIKYINTTAKEIKASTKSQDRVRVRLFLKTALITFVVTLSSLLVIGILLGIVLYPQVKTLSSQVETTYAQGKKVQQSLKDKDIKATQDNLLKLKDEAGKTRTEFNKLSFLRFVPILAAYYSDGEHLLNSADIALELGSETVTIIQPYADVLGFKGSSSQLKADEKAQKIIQDLLPKLTPLVDEATTKLQTVEKEVNAIDPNHYPAGLEIKGLKVRDSLLQAKKYLAKIDDFLPQVKPLILAAPDIAGEPTQKTYLILLQNDKELRPTGGFITSYGLAKVQGGRLVDVETDDIYQLDLKYKTTIIAPDAERKYVGWEFLPIRDSNLNPDFVVSAKLFESMYNTIKGLPKVDGVIALDTEFVRTFLAATGPITTKKTKETFSAENNRLGIPDVVYKLELHAEKINQSKPDRKGILGELMNGLLDKVLNAKPEQLPKYIETFADTVTRKHILFYFHNTAVQNFVEKYNAAGRITDYDKDYFHLNNANFGGLKGNLYIKQSVVQNINIDPDGTVIKSVDVTLNNPVKADGWLNSIYLNWMRIYVPEGSQIIKQKVQKDFTSGVELGKEVFRGYGATYPLNSSTFNFTYKLPFQVNPNEDYRMFIQKQAGVDNIHMVIKINGVTKEDFYLNQDKELTLKP